MQTADAFLGVRQIYYGSVLMTGRNRNSVPTFSPALSRISAEEGVTAMDGMDASALILDITIEQAAGVL